MDIKQKNTISLLLTDDDPITRAGVRALLMKARDIRIVGEAKDGYEAQQMVARLHPKVLLLDLRMPGLSAAELEKWVRENHPETVTLVLTAHDRDAYLASMIEAGAAGYMSKDESAEGLISAVRRAAQGEILFDVEQFARARRWRETVTEKWGSLTERERQVLKLVAAGMENKDISEALQVTPRTAAFHISRILEKLGVDTRYQAMAWYRAHADDLEKFLR